MTGAVLEIERLGIGFRTERGFAEAVSDVSFSVSRQRTLCLVGESGSGKSVTCQAILGLFAGNGRRTGGRILFEGDDLATATEAELQKRRGRDIGMVFQDPLASLNPVRSVGAQLHAVLALHTRLSRRQRQARALELLGLVGIADAPQRLASYPHQFSGGMAQRVMIAMALACSPRLLIADEPTTALDVTIQAQILDLLARLKSELGMAMLFVTHDLGVVREIADDVVVMRHGRVVESGPVADILTAPRAPYTRELLEAVVRLDVPAPAYHPHPGSPGVTTAPLLRVEELRRHYPAGRLRGRPVRAVDAVSFDIRPGETLGLVGESGCGKSTTGRLVTGLDRATDGRIRFDGEDITDLSESAWRRRRRDIQIIFQNPQSALDPRMTLRRQIREPLDLHDIGAPAGRDAEVDRLMQTVALPPELATRYPHQISGGQAQRAVIARALALRPRLIVCDEPVSALDVSVQATVTALLMSLQQSDNIAYLFISHDLRVVKKLSHRVAVMYLGEIVEEGPTDALYARPLHPYTIALISAIPRDAPGARLRLAGDPPSPEDPPAGCRFHTRCPFARPRCAAEHPELRPLGAARVRCHFAEAIAA